MHGFGVDVDISFRRREMGMAHDALDDTWLDVLFRQGGGSGMAAGIGRKAANTGTLQRFVIDCVEIVFVYLDELIV